MTWLKDLEWFERGPWDCPSAPLTGKAVCIWGGGPSFTRQVMDQLHGTPSIYVNNAFMVARDAGLVVALDRRWWGWHANNVAARGFVGVTASRPNGQMKQYACLKHLEKKRESEYNEDTSVLCGNNSGHAAIHLAAHLGATTIYLAGFDLDFPNGKSHWHEGHNVPASIQNYQKRFKPALEKLVKHLELKDVSVSAITRTTAKIPTTPIEDAVKELGRY